MKPRVEVSATGWQASLELAFERRNAVTVLAGNLHSGPLQVQKALYPEAPSTCHIAILHPPGGIAAGDKLALGAVLRPGARALLTTPGAAKWYRSEGGWASQRTRFMLEDDAVLEWLPRETIVFDGAQPSTGLSVDLAAGSGYFGWEILGFGRSASGETWRRGRFRMNTIVRQSGRMLWSETAELDASSGFAQSLVGLGGFTVSGTFMVAGYEIADDLIAACREAAPVGAHARSGITRLPRVLIARFLGDSTEAGFEWFVRLWAVLRPVLTGRTACAPRVWAC